MTVYGLRQFEHPQSGRLCRVISGMLVLTVASLAGCERSVSTTQDRVTANPSGENATAPSAVAKPEGGSAPSGTESLNLGKANNDGTGTLWPIDQATIVEIDFRDGSAVVFRLEALPQPPTIMEVMKLLRQHPRSPELKIRGEADLAFLESIDGLGTEGGKGWLYKVDGRPGDRSIGIYELKPGQVVRWSHGSFGDD
jgi:hypothetical protein